MTEIESDAGWQDVATRWGAFEDGLACYLREMAHQDDHLVVEAPDGGGESGTAPYAQFRVSSPGVIRAELSGNPVLLPEHQLSDDLVEGLVEDDGWQPPSPEEGFPNFSGEVELDSVAVLATMVRSGFEAAFGIPDPGLLSYRAWGPASEHVDELGLVSSDEITDDVVNGTTPAVVPRDRDHLVELVDGFLAEHFDEPVEQDDDGDIVIPTGRFPAYLRVRHDQPALELFAVVVHGVRSRRQAAIELAVLNRDTVWTKYVLRDRAVCQTLCLLAAPFVAEHLAAALPMFLAELDSVRDDLALRTGGRW
jgi:antitoxin component of MazEF toxin-antitoxin module